jgi:hypothetical protein
MYTGKGRPVQFENVVSSKEWEGLPQSGKSINRKLPHGAAICATGLMLPESLTLDQWKDVGFDLCIVDSGVQWAIGDWWFHGRHTYGKRKAYATAKELPYQFGSLMNLGCVAGSVKSSSRNELLSFTHHVAVAPLEPEDQKRWLAKAVERKWSVNQLREHIHDADQRVRMGFPGFGGLDAASSWLFNFKARARRSWPPFVEWSWLDDLSDADVADLIDEVSAISKEWSAITHGLDEHQRKRTAADSEQPMAVQPR